MLLTSPEKEPIWSIPQKINLVQVIPCILCPHAGPYASLERNTILELRVLKNISLPEEALPGPGG